MIFAANFTRCASRWLADQAQPAEDSLHVRKLGIKRQVLVAAHVSAQVIRNSQGGLLKFSEHSVLGGKVRQLMACGYPLRDRPRSGNLI